MAKIVNHVNMEPSDDNIVDIGSSSKQFKRGYFRNIYANIPVSDILENTILNDTYCVCLCYGNIHITLPSAIGREGKIYIIKKMDSAGTSITIDSSDPTTTMIDGQTEKVLSSQYSCITIISNNMDWCVIATL